MKSFFALALVVILSGSAVADNGISSKTLNEMGLAGIQVMSDEAAMEIRGMGYSGGHKSKISSKSVAFGVSYAKIEEEGGYKGPDAEAGTLDGFLAVGMYSAAGEHGSEAGITKTETKSVTVPGAAGPLVETCTTSIRVFAGGFAKASSL